jgi:hypothetical protein
MSSKTFIEIHKIVIKLQLNSNGFRARDIIDNTLIIKESTIRTFIPKHARLNTIYFKRVGKLGSGLYKINREFI